MNELSLWWSAYGVIGIGGLVFGLAVMVFGLWLAYKSYYEKSLKEDEGKDGGKVE